MDNKPYFIRDYRQPYIKNYFHDGHEWQMRELSCGHELDMINGHVVDEQTIFCSKCYRLTCPCCEKNIHGPHCINQSEQFNELWAKSNLNNSDNIPHFSLTPLDSN